MPYTHVKELDSIFQEDVSINCTVYLIRKISGHVVETRLTAVSVGTIPQAEVSWLKSERYTYRLNLKDNTVHAIDATAKHKDEMKAWYEVWEPQRLSLIKLCELTTAKEKKRRKHGSIGNR